LCATCACLRVCLTRVPCATGVRRVQLPVAAARVERAAGHQRGVCSLSAAQGHSVRGSHRRRLHGHVRRAPARCVSPASGVFSRLRARTQRAARCVGLSALRLEYRPCEHRAVAAHPAVQLGRAVPRSRAARARGVDHAGDSAVPHRAAGEASAVQGGAVDARGGCARRSRCAHAFAHSVRRGNVDVQAWSRARQSMWRATCAPRMRWSAKWVP
jgi:hypothetical protein